jgi:release factor glutamine methyltransferase
MIESELLFTQVLDCDRVSLYLNKDRRLTLSQAMLISSSLARRIKGEPLQYILGKAEFMGLEFKVNKNVLIPRPETEILVESAIRVCRHSEAKPKNLSERSFARPFHGLAQDDCFGVRNILDIGTGSGCIAISLARLLKDAKITAVDISDKSLEVAVENAKSNNVDINFIQSDLFSNYKLRAVSYDLIISNPPYIPRDQFRSLQPELKYEPFIALDGGSDGLEFYRRIIKEAPDYLRDNGILMMEMGFNQKKCIEGIFSGVKHFDIIEIIKDYNNIDRIIVAKKGRRNG